MTGAAIDSRQYIVALELRSTADCPPDFELPPSLAAFETGLFLPRDDPDWLGRSAYPPRVLLLNGGALDIVAHPGAGEPACRCALEQISAVESGHMLLKGWLRFTGSGFDYTLRYNTRGFPSVFPFMQRFRGKWLHGAPCGTPAVDLGAGLDIKFANALARELDAGESILMQAFQAPRPGLAGDLLALTDRRLLWITDRERGFRSRYGSIASYAPLEAVLSVETISRRGKPLLQVALNGGSAWQVPILPEFQRAAEGFAAAASMMRTSRPYRCAAERT
jgi:hypothetical protein